MISRYLWWQSGVVYQIYPRSFQDSDGDGVGDLAGVIQRLDYLQWLGVDALWLSPIYPSPMADFGYDIANYTDIDPLFGSLADFDRLLGALHARGMRLILDLVPNHTSDEHPWFVQARSSRTSPFRDWYIWRDPAADGGPPNNWLSYFGGPAWSFDQTTGQYYLHLFDPKQPDLNWRNPAVRTAIYDVVRFWLARGVDGFRVDVIWMLIKHPDLPDNPPDPAWTPAEMPQHRLRRIYDQHQPEVHEVIRELRAVTDQFADRVLIGEMYLPVEDRVSYYGAQLDEVHLPANFDLVTLRRWSAAAVRELVEKYEGALPEGGWPNWVLGNHDQPRIASRVSQVPARLAQLLLLTLRGTPTIYYGDEIAMEDVAIPPEREVDPQGLRAPGFSRDPARTPMQWSGEPGAGFTSGEPWLPIAADYAERNVAVQRADLHSMLNLTQQLLELRRTSAALSVGSYSSCPLPEQQLFAYLRAAGDERMLVLLNVDGAPVQLDLRMYAAQGRLRISTLMDRRDEVSMMALTLRPYEGVVIELPPTSD